MIHFLRIRSGGESEKNQGIREQRLLPVARETMRSGSEKAKVPISIYVLRAFVVNPTSGDRAT